MAIKKICICATLVDLGTTSVLPLTRLPSEGTENHSTHPSPDQNTWLGFRPGTPEGHTWQWAPVQFYPVIFEIALRSYKIFKIIKLYDSNGLFYMYYFILFLRYCSCQFCYMHLHLPLNKVCRRKKKLYFIFTFSVLVS